MAKFSFLFAAAVVVGVVLPSILCDEDEIYTLNKKKIDKICGPPKKERRTVAIFECYDQKEEDDDVKEELKEARKACSKLTNGHNLEGPKGYYRGVCKGDYKEDKDEDDLIRCIVKEEKKRFGTGERLKRIIRQCYNNFAECADEYDEEEGKKVIPDPAGVPPPEPPK